MKKYNLMKLYSLCLVSAMTLMPITTYASPLEDAKNIKAETEEKLTETNKEIEEIQENQAKLQEEIEKLDAELVSLLIDIDVIKEEIIDKKQQIEDTQLEYDEAKKEEEKQYELLKKRMQYLYENPDSNSTTMLFTGKKITSTLNKSTLSSEIHAYDKKQLDVYEEAKLKVESLMEKLQAEKDELEENEMTLKEQQNALEKIMKEKRETSEGFDEDLKKAEELASQYKATIDQQNAIITEQLEQMYRSTTVGAYDKSFVAPGDGKGAEIANYALQFLGNPYVWGGTSLTNGTDCSGFVQSVYAHFGYNLSRTTYTQQYEGRAVSFNELQPGDLVCYSGHIAIYIGYGKIVHASSETTGIKISNDLNYKSVVAFRRIVD